MSSFSSAAGDLFDEGKWCQAEEFVEYVARFHRLFAVPDDSHVLIAVGNHDIGFHYRCGNWGPERLV